jgi:hypothetical protein
MSEMTYQQKYEFSEREIKSLPRFIDAKVDPPIGDYYYCKVDTKQGCIEKAIVEWAEHRNGEFPYMDWDLKNAGEFSEDAEVITWLYDPQDCPVELPEAKECDTTDEDQGVAADTQISLSIQVFKDKFRAFVGEKEVPMIAVESWIAEYVVHPLAGEVERLRGEREALRELVLYAKDRIASVGAKDVIDAKLHTILNPKPHNP